MMLTFDDLSPGNIPNGYAGFDWSNFFVGNTSVTSSSALGYAAGVVSAPNFAYNGNNAPHGMLGSFSDPSGTFTLTSGYFTSAWYDQSVTVTGYLQGNPLDSSTFAITTGGPVLETFNWSGIDEISLNGSSGSQVVLDDLNVTTPLPGALPLFATALILAAAVAKLVNLRHGFNHGVAFPAGVNDRLRSWCNLVLGRFW